MKRRIRVAVVFGGPSPEHDVSIMSARSVTSSLDLSRYVVTPLKLPRATNASVLSSLARRLRTVDVVFPLGHGTFMEDGRLQSWLDAIGKPYVGSGMLASALAMDKHASKRLFHEAGLPTIPYIALKKIPQRISQTNFPLKFPVFVKPSNGGSSIGITKVGEWLGLTAAVRRALRYDNTALIEQAVPRARELEIAIIGNDRPRAGVVGEIIPAGEYYDYQSKYADQRTRLIIPAPLDVPLARRMQAAALAAFQTLGCRGYARIDFLMPRGSARFVVSEINTIPGFTASSMFPKLWAASGISYLQLLDRLITLAVP